MNRMITPFVLTFSLLVLLPSLTTSAQPTDPSLLLPGAAVDSITGGRPSVMIRRTTPDDRTDGGKHAIETDPIRGIYYTNLAYHYRIVSTVSIGARVQFAPGFTGIHHDEPGWGAGLVLKGFLFPSVSPNLYLNVGINYYSGRIGFFDQAIPPDGDFVYGDYTAVTGYFDVAYRFGIWKFYIDLQTGLTKPLKEIDMPESAFDGDVIMVGEGRSSDMTMHGGLQLGFRF